MQLEIQRKINKYYSNVPKWFYDWGMNLGKNKIIRESFFDNLDMENNQKVLEMACGTGLNFEYYPEGPEYYAVDINEKMLNKAMKRAKKLSKNINIQKENALALSFEDDAFDVALITYGLSAIPNNIGVISELERVVKKGGKIGILDFVDARYLPAMGGQVRLNTQSLIKRCESKVIYKKTSPIFKNDDILQVVQYILRVK